MRRFLMPGVVAMAALAAGACGSTRRPGPGPDPGPGPPPPNSPPVIQSIVVQGARPKEPASFADLGETLNVSASVTDAETALEQLQYAWTASAGTFSGTGATVTWQAPAGAAVTPTEATLTLKVTEKFGNPGAALSFEQSVTKSVTVSLHDSIAEVGSMARQFLLDFSNTSLKDADFIMRNFGTAATCPEPGEIQSERGDVIENFTKRQIVNFRVDPPRVSVNFSGVCPFQGNKGDACAVVGVLWDSIEAGVRGTTTGDDIVAAAYSPRDARWFLCASHYNGRNLLTGASVVR